MGDEWHAAVAGDNSAKLSELVLSSAGDKVEAALSILRGCVAILEKNAGEFVIRLQQQQHRRQRR